MSLVRIAPLGVAWLVLVAACKEDVPSLDLDGRESDDSAVTVPDDAPDAELEPDSDLEQPVDAGTDYTPGGPGDAAAPRRDASSDPAVQVSMATKQALCTSAYDSVRVLDDDNVIRGSWQFNPGGDRVTLPEPGYPCKGFLQAKAVEPESDDPRWTDAPDGRLLGFSEASTVPDSGYTVAQFRYFRSLIYVPEGAGLSSLNITAKAVDDAVYLELYNSRYPEGVSPLDVGPSESGVGACNGNDQGSWNFAKYLMEGEVNVLVLIHADLNPATSTLGSVDIKADNAPVRLVSCKDES